MKLPIGLLPKPGIESHKLKNLNLLKGEFFCNPLHSTWADIAKSLLPKMKQRKDGAPFRNWIPGN
jgi:hypothetical protein